MNLDLKLKREEIQKKALEENYAIVSFKMDGTIKDANERFLNLFGYDLDEIIDKHHRILCDDDYASSSEYRRFWYQLSSGRPLMDEFKRVKKGGSSVYLHAVYKPIIDDNGHIYEIMKFAQDITQKKLESLNFEGQLKAINRSQAIIEFDMDGYILDANKNFLDAMCYELEDILGKHHQIFCEKEYALSDEYKSFWEKLREGSYDTGKYARVGKDGKKVWIQATYTPILNLDKKPVKIVKFAQDITLSEIVKTDQLTGLYNREKLLVDIKQNSKNNLAIVEINLISFIYDFLGQSVADELILKSSKELRSFFDSEFELYKASIDKFAVLNTTLSKEQFISKIKDVSNKLRNVLIDLGVKQVHLLNTCGVSCENKDKILQTAEIVSKYAKKKNKSLVVYSNELNIEKEYEENLRWAQKIKAALDEDRVVVFYQALYNNKTKEIDKYESLVRIIDTDGSVISPFKFLGIAKKSRQYLDITKRVILKSFENFKDKDYQFSINLTVEDILDEELKKYLFEMIRKYDIASKLVIELVESEKITTYDPVFEFIDKIKLLGCEVAIDDFGSGYSNFEYLVKIDANFVKIDGSIIKRILEDKSSLEVVKAILNFSNKMGIKTIAEFISSKELLQKVQELGIDYSQGFYIHEPSADIKE